MLKLVKVGEVSKHPHGYLSMAAMRHTSKLPVGYARHICCNAHVKAEVYSRGPEWIVCMAGVR